MEYQDAPADPSAYLPHPPQPYCTGCDKTPEEIDEYVICAKEDGMTPTEWVRREEGTLNPANGHFLCTDCYIRAGMPSTPYGWVAP
jgi:hypothetical protein